MHLWDVSNEDELVKNAKAEIMEILEHNLNAAEMALGVYDDYLFLLKERPRIEKFCNEEHTRDQYMAEIRKYEDTVKSIRKNMPFEIRMNMFLIDCAALNADLIKECEDLISIILKEAADMIFSDMCAAITTGVKKIQEDFGTKVETSKRLVEAEKRLEEVRLHEQGRLCKEYEDLLEWLLMLYNNPRYFSTESLGDNIKSVHGAFTSMRSLPSIISG